MDADDLLHVAREALPGWDVIGGQVAATARLRSAGKLLIGASDTAAGRIDVSLYLWDVPRDRLRAVLAALRSAAEPG